MNETVTTETAMPQPAPLKRCAILGTAPSWAQCPWTDTTLEIWGLNDGYMLGVPRADRWYDLHPFYQMLFRGRTANGLISSGQAALDVPIGVYHRPDTHLDWLKTRPIPVYLQEAKSDYPTSRTFPKAELLQWFARYWPYRVNRKGTVEPGPDYEVSTPSWMLMHAIAEGYQEIHIYGIHLATEWEYVQQRPNFEFLIGVAAGRGVKIVLPESATICKASYRYAFEPKADIPLQQAQQQIQRVKHEGAALHQRRAALPWYAHGDRLDLGARLAQLDIELLDAKQTISRLQLQAA